MAIEQGEIILSLMIEKVPTGIKGFDEITNGGLPKGKDTHLSGDI